MAKGRIAAGGFALVFVGFWSLLTLLFDGFIVYGVARQVVALTYATAPGQITSSRVEMHPGASGTRGGGPTWSAEVSFRFTVAGREYTSDRWRYSSWSTDDSAAAQRIVARYPAGSQATVRYNPRNPADAVLAAGVQEMDAILLLFMTPFNAVMLGGWIILAGLIGGIGPFAPRPMGARIWEAGEETRVRLMGMSPPCIAGLATAGIMGFVLTFIMAFAFRFTPPVAVAAGAWGACILAGLVVYAVARSRLSAGRRDLRIDYVRKVMTLPPAVARAQDPEVPFASVTAVEVAPGAWVSNGKRSSWKVVIKRRQGKDIKLIEGRREEEMQALARWLREQAGCNAPAAEAAAAAST